MACQIAAPVSATQNVFRTRLFFVGASRAHDTEVWTHAAVGRTRVLLTARLGRGYFSLL